MPNVKIIGVHPLDVSDEMFDQAVTEQHGLIALDLDQDRRERAVSMTSAGLSSIAVIELVITDRDRHMYIGDFGQSASGYQLGPNDEVASFEVFLNDDGNERVANYYEDIAGTRVRLAFVLHDHRPRRPLLTPYGPKELPLLTPLPMRLRRLVQYTPR